MSASDAQETDGRTVPFIKFIALRSPPSSPRAMNVDNRVSVVRPPREGGTAVLKQNRVRERARAAFAGIKGFLWFSVLRCFERNFHDVHNCEI